MSTTSNIPDLKRIQFFAGQRLTAQDLTDVQRANLELRWLHNRSLHGWGIGVGYGVTGERGDTSVTVAPGYALDCMGRELILTESVTVTVPAIAGNSDGTAATFFLTVSYLDDADQSTVETRPGVCLPAGTVRLTEGPLIQWQELKDISAGMNVILAQASVLNCQLDSPLALDVRRSARPLEQPYISSGQVAPGDVVWAANSAGNGLTTRVDTSDAKFQATPAYFAHVMGPRLLNLGAGAAPVLILVSVSQPAADGFNCDILLLGGSGNFAPLDPAELSKVAEDSPWTVVWMGVEG